MRVKGEVIHQQLHPHPLGMYPLYAIWTYLIVAGAFFMRYRAEVIPWVMGRVSWLVRHDDAYLVVWGAALVIPAIVISVTRIRWRWLFFLAGAGLLGFYLKEYTALGVKHGPYWVDNIENVTLITFGLLGIAATEMHRRCHLYLVTDRRVILRYRGLGGHERSIFYSRIDDLVLRKSFLGKLFGFGSVVPLSSSGLGMGSVSASASGMIGGRVLGANVGLAVGGGHSQNVVKEDPTTCLYNIPDPHGMYELIAAHMGHLQAAA